MKYIKVLVLIVSILIVSCNSIDNYDNPAFFEINVRKSLQEKAKTHLVSAFFKEVNYIPLETTEEALLRSINKVIMYEDYLFVSDNRFVYQFDDKGNFIRKIGTEGSGPGEFIGMIRFTIDPVNSEVLIYSTKTHILNAYNLKDGAYKTSREMPFFVSDFAHFKDGSCVFLTREFRKEFDRFTTVEAYLLNSNREIKDSVRNNLRNNIANNSMGYASLFTIGDEINYIYNYRDTLYVINHEFERKPLAWLVLNNQEDSDILEVFPTAGQIQYPNFLWISNIVGNSDYYFITVKKGFAGEDINNSSLILYSKKEKISSHIASLENDYDYNMPFWPRWIQDNKLISFYQSYDVLAFAEKIKNGNNKSELLRIANKLSESDNPVIVIVK
ncbi:MAG: 6-bladed beta-propeller [Bacteroidetes bacterium]|nr:6-bladed beta-propeller [Bacteroidota bacterium]